MDPLEPILSGLNTAQKAAVTSPASILQVLAPPGSGKTRTLTSRVAYLLAHNGYRPQDVICCTFTIKASREMRERLGLMKGFGIADSGDSLAIIRRIVKRLQLGIQPNTARSRISHQKAHGVSPDEVASKHNKESKILEHQEFVQVYREYEKELETSNLLDYDDLLLRCATLLREYPHCVSNVQVVLVDEFQDTNQIQYDLMNLFAARNRRITVVGDPDQSIYGFRSAEIKNLKRMQRLYSNTEVVLLEDNYRSSGSILKSAQDVIEQDSSRPAKNLQPTHTFGTLPVLRKLPSAEDEAQWLVLEIKRCMILTGKLLNYSDFAILLRSASLSRHIESAMGKHGIPYRMVGGLRFFDRVEIKLLLDYLRVISHPDNTEALLRIINVPSRKIGEETIRLLVSGAEKANKSLWNYIKDVAQGRRSTEKALSKPASHGLSTLVGLIEYSREKLRQCFDKSAPRKLLEIVMKKLSFREFLTATYGSNDENRWANVEELMTQADDATAAEENEQDENLPEIEGIAQQEAHAGEEALSRFLANVALSTEVQPKEGAEGEEQSQEKVTISTIHAAKGLEWPVVFVPAAYEGIIPHSRAEDSDEERRLLYVAMTRAQALLYLSYPLRQARDNAETSVTSFLPQELITSRMRTVGPRLEEKVVYGIADILRRERPTAAAMLEGLDSLPSVYDDRWTEDGQEAPGTVIRWDGSRATDDGPNSKRRRYDNEQYSTTTAFTTMSSTTYTMTGSSFMAPTTMSGFSTAREYIATTTQKQEPPAEAERTNKQKQAVALNRPPPSQKSIASFFGGSSSQSTQQTRLAQPPPPPPQNRPGAMDYPGRSLDARPSNAIPSQYTGHRPGPPTQQFRPPRPALEPSDPNRYTWLAASSKPAGKVDSPSDQMNTNTIYNNEGGRKESVANQANSGAGVGPGIASVGAGGMRPATTFHTTTMSMVQSQGGPARRTLGIRRSMNGWEERMKRASK
ncbi:ATP-dependent helicase [Aspergillus mulundensis]|uniref:DNA 3'-5' helicase n=1 Tax=Aspergillus mulundensis TaxID=1810919 RepID=A0A3D8T5S8_9EURO|nr:DNA helicase and DNA-dependent ATPase [Aspergillus mulundensis]RDW93926.1 DNA helicase and DNA-dependent ATPase [Aspergillus mulundensis]